MQIRLQALDSKRCSGFNLNPPKGQAAEQWNSLLCQMLVLCDSDKGNSDDYCCTFQSRQSSTPNTEKTKPTSATDVEMYKADLQSAEIDSIQSRSLSLIYKTLTVLYNWLF